ncbi:hypothetical protein N7478_006160 [Penicillium angulare]|uniref:uncharacterized protein n=1 Tax=Penicillium angulare TaxID=116970 RepID=UPI002540AC4B|nr:uncharacterized protein N7478_006160 [Penicillium angulare]KAJ5280788.1 hypothetical protein N7478_006160 [Penicillium angulare]
MKRKKGIKTDDEPVYVKASACSVGFSERREDLLGRKAGAGKQKQRSHSTSQRRENPGWNPMQWVDPSGGGTGGATWVNEYADCSSTKYNSASIRMNEL